MTADPARRAIGERSMVMAGRKPADGPKGYRSLKASGMSSADVEKRVVEVVAADKALEVRRLGEGRLGVYRNYRPTWALVLAIVLFPLAGVGLLFLLVRKAEQGEILVVDGPTGPHVTLPPVVPPALDASLSDRLGAAGGYQPKDDHVPPEPSTAGPSERAVPLIAAIPGVDENQDDRTRELTPLPQNRVAEPSTGAADDIDSATIRRSETALPKSAGGSGVTLVFDEVTVIVAPGESVVLGRDPRSGPGERPVVVPGHADTVSKSHAVVRAAEGRANVTDLDSTNGTRIERAGTAMEAPAGTAVSLSDRDVLVLGAVRAVVERA